MYSFRNKTCRKIFIFEARKHIRWFSLVRIRFSSAIAAAVNGEAEATLDFEGDVGALVALLSQRYGEGFRRRILSEGRINGFISIYLNGEDIRFLKELQTAVKNGDTIYITPAVSGG